jgi:nucleotide sugar dehydrogenase
MAESQGIAVIGSGYVGTVVAACFAHVGHSVTGVESAPDKLSLLRRGRVPFFEPGLEELVAAQVAEGRLTFTDDYDDALSDAALIFLCVGTPAGVDGSPDLTAMASAGMAIAGALRPGQVVVTKSTVPIGNGPWLRELIDSQLAEPMDFSVVSNPEFLREGRAIRDFLYPERIVIGSDDAPALDQVAAAYGPILDQSFGDNPTTPLPRLIRTDLATAETIKYASNAFLATKISFINEIASLCEPFGADVTEIALALGLDSRIGPDFLQAGVGWGGSCFGKDLAGLEAAAHKHGIKPKILEATRHVNEAQRFLVMDKLQKHLGSVDLRRIAVLGLAFKPDTDDVRDSPAVAIVHQLLRAGALVTAHDPLVAEVDSLPDLITYSDPFDAARGADAVVIATDWRDFRDLDLAKLRSRMAGNLIIDGRNLLDPAAVTAAGFVYEGVGRRKPAPTAS